MTFFIITKNTSLTKPKITKYFTYHVVLSGQISSFGPEREKKVDVLIIDQLLILLEI